MLLLYGYIFFFSCFLRPFRFYLKTNKGFYGSFWSQVSVKNENISKTRIKFLDSVGHVAHRQESFHAISGKLDWKWVISRNLAKKLNFRKITEKLYAFHASRMESNSRIHEDLFSRIYPITLTSSFEKLLNLFNYTLFCYKNKSRLKISKNLFIDWIVVTVRFFVAFLGRSYSWLKTIWKRIKAFIDLFGVRFLLRMRTFRKHVSNS